MTSTTDAQMLHTEIPIGLHTCSDENCKKGTTFLLVIVSDTSLPRVDLVEKSNLAHHSLSIEGSPAITQTSEFTPMAIPSLSTFIPGELTAFFLLIVFLVVLFLYVRVRRRTVPNSRLATSPSFFFSFSSSSAAEPLDPCVLKSLPSAVFRSATDAKAGHALECAVCLSELADGELVRLLPRCRHTFHLKCIGTWFLSNSTCPICRRSVEPSPVSEPSTPAEEDVKALALERLGSRGENSAYSSGGWDVEIGINGEVELINEWLKK